ncbi:MAG: GGDEF domain-containing protein [Oceanisphaera sp.]|uniref:putative bifunctional diguanylate cyclase/phosphodiesterase n=1 Tax=Oceanisphaera sp. TaxID=1929979 RepID=UPI003C725966
MKQELHALAAQQSIHNQIAHRAPFGDILSATIDMVTQQLPDALVSFMRLDPEDNTLSIVASNGLSDSYHQRIQKVPVGPTSGTCGVSAYRREIVITDDIEQDINWIPFVEYARLEGLVSCWSAPVLTADGELLGTFATYYRYPRMPTHKEQTRLIQAAGLLALAIAHQRDLQQLNFQRTHDQLTGLLNRTAFETQLAYNYQLFSHQSRRITVLVINLDGFKSVNDGLGHHIGDRLLQAVAERLLAWLQPQDMVARLGGDDFGLLLLDREQEDIIQAAESLLTLLSRPFTIDEHQLHISVSIGITTSGESSRESWVFIQHAHFAMREAKLQGRNTWQLYSGDISSQICDHIALRREILEAIEGEQLVVYYQPLVDARTGKVRSVEALVRWDHPQRGMVPPDDFIPLAEQTGQIIGIDQWVLRQACLDTVDINASRPASLRIGVAVNISPVHFRRAGFFLEVQRVLEETGLEPYLLELEVTEGVLMSGADKAIEQLKALRHLGVLVAIDDFGTGFSSLSYLRKLPISKVKLDRSFIQSIDHNRDNAAIVQGVITMAHHLGLQVVAEGVETLAEHEDLIKRGCDLLQGYRFSRPVPLSLFMELPAILPAE